MKVLVICQYFSPEQFHVNNFCFELIKEGHEVTVLTGLPNYPSGIVDEKYRGYGNKNEEINGVNVIRCWLIGRGKGKIRLALNYISFAVSATLKALFIKKDFDVILVYQLSPITMAFPGVLLKKITRKPLVIYCFDLWPESVVASGISTQGIIYRLLLRLCRWIYISADAILTSSKMFKEYFQNVLNVHENINHLPVYAESIFENLKDKDKNDHNVSLVFAGNIGEMQSVETIIYAANELKNDPNIVIHIVGDGSSRRKCEELAKQFELENIIFHGKYPVTDMPRFYEMADAFLVTLKANEFISYTLPNKVQSYMAAGKPIIGAINGETQKVIQEAACGLCADAEDYKGLSDNIKRFVQEQYKHAGYGNSARAYYDKHYTKMIYMKRLNDLLRQFTKNGD